MLRNITSKVPQKCKELQQLLNHGVKVMSDKGSMTKETLPIFIRHFHTFVRRHVPETEKVLLTFDGYSSRKGFAWLEEACKGNIEVAKAPANTSHVLQPCDQKVNKVIKTRVSRVRNQLVSAGMSNTKRVKFKIISALTAIDNISLNDIRTSFAITGIWPMGIRFSKSFESQADRIKQSIEKNDGNARKPDALTARDCQEVLQIGSFWAEEPLQRVSNLLKNRDTENSIVMSMKANLRETHGNVSQDNSERAASCTSTNVKKKNHRMGQGLKSPARHLTHGESVIILRDKLAKEEELENKKKERSQEPALNKLVQQAQGAQKKPRRNKLTK